jgi:hypothetical protein
VIVPNLDLDNLRAVIFDLDGTCSILIRFTSRLTPMPSSASAFA